MSASSVVGRELGGIVILFVFGMDVSALMNILLQDAAPR